MINYKLFNKEKVDMTDKFNILNKGDVSIMSKINYIKRGVKYIIGTSILFASLGSAAFGLTKDYYDYYKIYNKNDLKEFTDKVNSGEEPDAKGKLMEDIIWNGSGVIENGDIRKGGLFERFIPIGTGENKFRGELTSDGDMKRIKGIYINENEDFQGLCGILTREGKINNIEITDSYISGKDCIGGIAGANEAGEIENVKVTDSCIKGGEEVGGIVGINGYNMTNCITDNIIVEGIDRVGGIVGFHQGIYSPNGEGTPGILRNCKSSGIVKGINDVGGNVGYCGIGYIEGNCENNATVEGKVDVGGNVGRNGEGNCENYAAVTGNNNVGGNIGQMNAFENEEENENKEDNKEENENKLPPEFINNGNITGENNVGGNIGYNKVRKIHVIFKNKGCIEGKQNVGTHIGRMEARRLVCDDERCKAGSCYSGTGEVYKINDNGQKIKLNPRQYLAGFIG